MADALGLSVLAWAPLGGGVLTGNHTRGSTPSPSDSRRATDNQSRLTEANLDIAREVDSIADELATTSARVAIAWVRQRSPRLIPVVGVRTLDQLDDILGSLHVELPGEQQARLDKASQIELGFPYNLLGDEVLGQMVYGDLEPQIDLPSTAPYRWA